MVYEKKIFGQSFRFVLENNKWTCYVEVDNYDEYGNQETYVYHWDLFEGLRKLFYILTK